MINKFNEMKIDEMFSLENLFFYWYRFKQSKKKKQDICEFELDLYQNLSQIGREILEDKYVHGKYEKFYINDTKKREIHKATVKDRFIHFILYRNLYLYFEQVFVYDSYSCRINKGVQKAVRRFLEFGRKLSKNNTQKVFVLKLDIKKCFHSIDQNILQNLLLKYVEEEKLLKILFEIINSFDYFPNKKGIPLGNVSSQIFINIYLHELDIFIKNKLKIKYYIRYADDFIILETNEKALEVCKIQIEEFLKNKLNLEIKKEKQNIKSLSKGITFLGYKIFPKYITLKTKNKKRFIKKVNEGNLHSYLGFLKHCNSYKIQKELLGKVKLIDKNK